MSVDVLKVWYRKTFLRCYAKAKKNLRLLAIVCLAFPTSLLANNFEVSVFYADVFRKSVNGQEIWDFLANFSVNDGTYSRGMKLNGHALVESNGTFEFKINDFCPEDTPGLPQTCFWINNIIKYKTSPDAQKIRQYFKVQDTEKRAQLNWFCGALSSNYSSILDQLVAYADDPSNIEDRDLAKQLPLFFKDKRQDFEQLGRECLALLSATAEPVEEPSAQALGEVSQGLERRIEDLQLQSNAADQKMAELFELLRSVAVQRENDQALLRAMQTTINRLESSADISPGPNTEIVKQLSQAQATIIDQAFTLHLLEENQKEIFETFESIKRQQNLHTSSISELNRRLSEVVSTGNNATASETNTSRQLSELKSEISNLKAKINQATASPAPQVASDPATTESEFSAYLLGRLKFEIIEDNRNYSDVKDLFDDPVALWRHSVLLANGNGVKQDYDKAIADLVKSAELGYALAQNEVGTLYHNGTYFDRNYERAFYWYDLAARQGYGQAIANIAGMYAVGQHKPRSVEKSFELREIALEKGHGPSALRLGEEYFYGSPFFAPDCKKGKEYLIRAVKMGAPRAGQKLVKAYSHAVGTRAISTCASDIGANMESLDQVKKFVVFNEQIELNRRVTSAYYQLGLEVLKKDGGIGRSERLFAKYSTDQILEMMVFVFAEIEYLHQIGGDYSFSSGSGSVSTNLWAKGLLSGLVLENCGWVENPLIERWVLDAFDFNAIMGRSDYKAYEPNMTPGRPEFCLKAKQLLDARVKLSKEQNHSEFYGLLEPKQVIDHLVMFVDIPKL